MIKKKSPFDECSCFVCLGTQKKQKKSPSVRLYVRTLGRLENLSRCTITFEGVGASKENLVGVFYVQNVVLVLKFKVKL